MIIPPAEYDCRNANLKDITALTSSCFPILMNGDQSTNTIFGSALDFISEPIPGCYQTYRLEMANGDPLPSYYIFDPYTGELGVNRQTNTNDQLSD